MDASTKPAGAPASGSGIAAPAAQKIANLALQGGGTHGAFTWGALDRLLEEERLDFEGITATSAGAVNAVVLADGLAEGGREGARNALRRFWRKVSDAAAHSIFKPSLLDQKNPDYGLEHSPGYTFMEALTYYASPYQLNPFNYNPFKTLLEETIDFERVREQRLVKLFLCATNVQTAKVKIFTGEEIRSEHVLASACLPLVMQAVKIDGEYYWDGSYTGNPPIFPLIYYCQSNDIIMVHITPADRPGVPTTSPAIMNRMQEISFNTTLIREMRAISYLTRIANEAKFDGAKDLLMHLIEAEDLIRELAWSSRLNGSWDFLSHLHELGRKRADKWLAANFDKVGVASTVDLQAKYF
jgi:NTE family protein